MPSQSYTPREMIDRLVAFDTTSALSNMPLIDFVSDYLRSHGIEPVLIPNEDGTKANLLATIGPAVPGGVVLSGHTDVVPVAGQAWSSNPFRVTERDGRLYGRGTCDMKSFSAIALALVPEFLAMGLKRPIHLALSYDEEIGCVGVGSMIDHIRDHLPRPAAVIVGEPTNMTVVDAHKGIRSFETTVTGHEAHSSQSHLGVSAIMAANDLIGLLRAIFLEMKKRGDASGRFTPPFTSVQIGTIEGGTAINIIPKMCRFTWEYRALPDADEGEILRLFTAFAETNLLPRMREVSPDCAIETVQKAHAPGLAAEPGSAAEMLALRLAGANETHAVSFATEAGLFQAIGIPTVVCGPGDIAQAHTPDEFIEISQVEACEAFLRRLGAHLASV
jgi:acetylornithine deacetylase